MRIPTISVAAMLVLAACAPVKLYDHEGAEQVVGFPVHIPEYRQYLILARGDKQTTANIVTMPVYSCDTLYYVKPRGGWGGKKSGFELNNGALVKFSSESDGKGAETIAAVGAVASGIGSIVSGAAALKEADPNALQNMDSLRDALVGEFEKLQQDEVRFYLIVHGASVPELHQVKALDGAEPPSPDACGRISKPKKRRKQENSSAP